MAPVEGSGDWPAWIVRVVKPSRFRRCVLMIQPLTTEQLSVLQPPKMGNERLSLGRGGAGGCKAAGSREKRSPPTNRVLDRIN